MARPAPDISTIRADMLDMAETLLAESGGQRLVMSDIAKRLGMSQSYAHRFFPTKHDLVGAMAQKWFEEVESQGAKILASDASAPDRLRQLILQTLHIKRSRYDENPQLFMAYMDLARDHMPLVRQHSIALQNQLRSVLSEFVPERHLDQALALTEDASARFRIPQMIAQFRETATDSRANAVIDMILGKIQTL